MHILSRAVSSTTGPARRHSSFLLSGLLGAILAASQPAQALTINPIFEASWLASAPAGATTDVMNVIAEYQSDFSNPVTINISFGWGDIQGNPVTGGAVSNFPSQAPQYTLAQVKGLYATAVGLQPANSALATANANLPATYPNPGGASANFFVPDAEYKALTGVAQNADLIDGFTGYATNFCAPNPVCAYDFTGNTPPAGSIDFTSVVEHELSHAMGRVDWAFQSGVANGAPPKLSPLNFFTYDCNTTTLDPRFNITCFSIDGGVTNPQGRTFSNQSDSGDWINANTDSYNAFVFTGTKATVSAADILEMCALGWKDCAQVTPAPEPGTLALLSTSLLGLAALRRRRRA
jgi:PEP-CTERM motif